jgi:hypothetical protein
MQQEPRADPVETEDVFGFLADTLGEVARRIERLEAHAADMIGNAPQRPELLVVLQDFDLIRQMIEDTAELSAAAGRGRGRLQLAAGLRLRALRDRLLHGSDVAAGNSPVTGDGSSGKLDLFGS